VERIERRPPGIATTADSLLVLAGALGAETLAGSKWAAALRSHRGGILPRLDLVLHARLLEAVVSLVQDPRLLIDGIHDVSDGGVGLALAEMAVHSGVGFRIASAAVADHTALFGEGPSRVVLSVPSANMAAVEDVLSGAGIDMIVLGSAGGDRLIVDGLVDVALAEAVAASQGALPAALGAVGTH
jgi:phosphoribosylformylglycinamidine synthase